MPEVGLGIIHPARPFLPEEVAFRLEVAMPFGGQHEWRALSGRIDSFHHQPAGLMKLDALAINLQCGEWLLQLQAGKLDVPVAFAARLPNITSRRPTLVRAVHRALLHP